MTKMKHADLASLIETLEKAWELALHLELEEHENALYRLLRKADERALWRLAHSGGLIGAEYCDECAEVIGTITEVDCTDLTPMFVYRRPPGSECPNGSEYLRRSCGPFFRLPGSFAYAHMATAELLRKAA